MTPFTVALVLLAMSIVICTLDRTPRLWHESALTRVEQPPTYFEPRLPDRASIAPAPGRADRQVAFDRESGSLIDSLVTARGEGPCPSNPEPPAHAAGPPESAGRGALAA